MDDFSLKDFLNSIKNLASKYSLSIRIISFSFFIIGIIYALTLQDIYRSDALLIRAEGTKLESDSGSSIAGLLEIAGAGGDRMEVLAEQIVFSRDFYKYFVNKRNILPELIAANKYHKKSKTLSYDSSKYDFEKRLWKIEDPNINLFKHHNNFLSHFVLEFDPQTKTAFLNVFHVSPYVAQQWAAWFIEDLNTYISSIEIENAKLLYEYLETRVNTSTSSEVRRQIGNIMIFNLGKMALAERSSEYAYEVIDQPNIPLRKHSPRRSLIVLFFLFLGFAISLSRAYLIEKL